MDSFRELLEWNNKGLVSHYNVVVCNANTDLSAFKREISAFCEEKNIPLTVFDSFSFNEYETHIETQLSKHFGAVNKGEMSNVLVDMVSCCGEDVRYKASQMLNLRNPPWEDPARFSVSILVDEKTGLHTSGVYGDVGQSARMIYL